MDIDVNWMAVILATISSFAVGALWYSPLLFLEPWRKLTHLSKDDIKKGPSGRGWALTAVGGFLQALMLYYSTFLLEYFDTDFTWFSAALSSAVALWLGLQVAMLLVHDSFEQRPIKLTAITAGSQLATLVVMALIIGLM